MVRLVDMYQTWDQWHDAGTVPSSEGECAFRLLRYRFHIPNPRIRRAQLFERCICALGEQQSQRGLPTPD